MGKFHDHRHDENVMRDQANQYVTDALGGYDNVYIPTAASGAPIADVSQDERQQIRDQVRAQGGSWGSRHSAIRDQISALEAQRQQQQQAQQEASNASYWAGIGEDQQSLGAQYDALGRLNDVSRQGWTQTDVDALNAAQRQSALQEQAQRAAVLQQARMRGMGGSGLELAGALGAQQAGANRNADVAAQMGFEGRDRALQALRDYGSLAGTINQQRYGEQSNRADALDQFNQNMFASQLGLAQARGSAQQDAANYYQTAAQQAYQNRRQRWLPFGGAGLQAAASFGGVAGSSGGGGGGGSSSGGGNKVGGGGSESK